MEKNELTYAFQITRARTITGTSHDTDAKATFNDWTFTFFLIAVNTGTYLQVYRELINKLKSP